jgi:hypothetical protein
MEEGRSDEAARQQISRARGGIFRLSEIQFPKGERFIYLRDQYKSQLFYINLVSAFNSTSSIHKCIITGLNNFGGSITKDKLKIISGCPKSRKKKKCIDQVIRELENVGIINIDGDMCFLHEDATFFDKSYMDSRTIDYLNEFLREILSLWLKNNSLVSYDSISFTGDFCSYYWDIKAPSYLLPLIERSRKNVKAGFIVADIIPHYDIDEDDIDYFIRKVESCYAEQNSRPFIPILIGYRFNPEALQLLRKHNILAATVSNFFGAEIEKILNNIENILESKNIQASGNIGDVENILKEVSKIEGVTNNLRGKFFELLVYHIASKSHPGLVLLNKKIKLDDKHAEIDVLVNTSSEIIIYECKGKKPIQLVTDNDIDVWKTKVALIYEYLKKDTDNTNKRIKFNFWTASDFTDEANLIFKNMNIRKYTIERKNGDEIYHIAKSSNLEEICSILKQYFPYKKFREVI